MAGRHNVETFPIPPLSRSELYIMFLSWRRAFEGHRLLSVATPPVLSHYSHLTSLVTIPARPLFGVSPCWSLRSIYSLRFCAWPVKAVHPLTAGLVTCISGNLACWYWFHLVSVRLWKGWSVLRSCTIPISTCPWCTWPIVVVVTSISGNIRSQGFPTLSAWLKCSMFHGVLSSTRSWNSDGEHNGNRIVLAFPVFLYHESSLRYLLSGCCGFAGCVSTTHLKLRFGWAIEGAWGGQFWPIRGWY